MFKYDPFGRRIQKTTTAGTTNSVYDGANVVDEYSASGALVAKYAQGQGIDEPLGMWRNNSITYYHADGLGSITSLTDTTGTAQGYYSYDSFGKPVGSPSNVTNPYRYTGREWDSETNLYYYRARYYDPLMGRFVSEDPVRFHGGDNFYVYVENGPVDRVDPLGLCPWQVHRRPLKKIGKITGAYHVYFYNVQTGQSIGLGPKDGKATTDPVPGEWERDEKPGTVIGTVPEYSCDCVGRKARNPGEPPTYCATQGSMRGSKPGDEQNRKCVNCNGWAAEVLRDCRNELYDSTRR